MGKRTYVRNRGRECLRPDCANTALAKGLCRVHYQREWRARQSKGLRPVYVRCCACCGSRFQSQHPTAKYCTERCSRRAAKRRAKAKRKPSTRATCKGCGVVFWRKAGSEQVYHSLECQYSTRSELYRGRNPRPGARRTALPTTSAVRQHLEGKLPHSRQFGDYRRALRADPCAYCGGAGGHIDHIHPHSLGGGDGWDNMAGICSACNSSKHTHPLLWFMGWRRAEAEAMAWRG